MKRVLQIAVLSLPLGALAFFGAGSTADTAKAQGGSAPVHVVGPLPLPVAGTTSVAGEVQVRNTAGTPLYVVNAAAAQTPYQERRSFSFAGFCGFNTCKVQFSMVPAGKRLVITHVSGALYLLDGARVGRIYLSESTVGDTVRVHVPTQSEGIDHDGIESRQFSENTLLYVEAGNQPEITFQTSKNPGPPFQEVTLAGYYVDVP